MGFLLIGGILVVYIVLGILYESFIHPLTILSSLPAAAVGALLTLYLVGMVQYGYPIPLTLYAFVGMIMLVGLVKKNAIMMVDFALTRQRTDNVDPQSAIIEAALIRFRPIMMTSMAALFGTLPIAIGMGDGRRGAQAAGARRGRRTALLAGADALHHPGALRISRPPGLPVQPAQGNCRSRRVDFSNRRNQTWTAGA